MTIYAVILREAEALGVAKVAKGFQSSESAQEFAKKLVRDYTTDQEQLNFIGDRIGDPIEFVGDDDNYWQIEVCEVEVD
jgi:3-deoxy-D-manno-octulosonate 8-phosphate phosphatase KdsC-like HAD superfamily phosphatase